MGLDLVELMLAYEESFGIELPDGVVEKMFTPAAVIAFVESELRKRPGDPIRSLVAEVIRLRTIQQLGIKPKHYREDARFVQDFGAG